MYHAGIAFVELCALHAQPRTPLCLAQPAAAEADTMPPSCQGILHNVAAAPISFAAAWPTRPAIWPPELPTPRSSSRPQLARQSVIGDTPPFVSRTCTACGQYPLWQNELACPLPPP